MLLDLTVRPIQVVPDECPRSLVVRTLRTGTHVTGIIGRREPMWSGDRRADKHKPTPLEPVAQVERGKATYYETRLPLKEAHIVVRNSRQFQDADSKPTDKQLLPEPFEVSSAYKNVTTNQIGDADYHLVMEFQKKRCLVTVTCLTNSQMMLTVVLKDFDEFSDILNLDEPVPLQRLQKLQNQPASAWERMLDDEEF